ncbi:hypothetical protein D3C81_1488150 [compost metagenome]
MIQALVKGGQCVAAHVPVGQPAVEGIGSLHLVAGNAEVDAQFTWDAWEEIAAAHVREIADTDLRHTQPAALGDHTQVTALGQAHATAEGETVHQHQYRFTVVMDAQVERVFLDEEVFVQVVTVFIAVMQRADIATGAEPFRPFAT